MNSRFFPRCRTTVLRLMLIILAATPARAYELFIHRPCADRPEAVSRQGKIKLYGEIFAAYLAPSTFPSYNNNSGPPDRRNIGFQEFIRLTDSTVFLAQLITHDDGDERTKFDWHFALRQDLLDHLVLIIGHDSDHDSEHQSVLHGKAYYTNRNYIGLGLPFEGADYYIEPFVWFFHHTNHRAFLDMSGGKISQELGLRFALRAGGNLSLHLQVLAQSDKIFNLGQAMLGDLFVRLKVASWLEISLGGGIWRDLELSPLLQQQRFHKLLWGVAIPF
ncbi:MAG: hypothetical protein PHX45_02930 [Acidobacteriota bacterium]|nr:hypothetical protein [Acidobacteriota bacterium]